MIRTLNLAHCVLVLTLVLANMQNAAYAQTIPQHNDSRFRFIDPKRVMNCANDHACYQEADRYLQDIGIYKPNTTDPTDDRGTTRAWKRSKGFSEDPTKPNPEELRVVYWNAGDLELGRDMHCISRTTNATLFPPTEVRTFACYVTNYRVNLPGTQVVADNPFTGTPDIEASIANAARNINPVATVAMEETTLFMRGTDVIISRGNINFIAFDETNEGKAFSPVLDTNTGVASEDRRHAGKASPGTCLACHGGTYISHPPGISSVVARVETANFLPFNTAAPNFAFTKEPTLSQFSEVAQREAFRKMNRFVVTTIPSAIISELIKGWYSWCGGVSTPGCFIDETSHSFIPDAASFNNPCATSGVSLKTQTCGWANPSDKPKDLSRNVYQKIVAVYCRTCHVTLPEKLNVQQYHDWARNRTGGVVANEHFMPFAEVPYRNYWSNPDAQHLFGTFFPTQ